MVFNLPHQKNNGTPCEVYFKLSSVQNIGAYSVCLTITMTNVKNGVFRLVVLYGRVITRSKIEAAGIWGLSLF